MATYRIEVLPGARKVLRRLDPRDRLRLVGAIDRLAENPYPPDARRLQGQRQYLRIRVGAYRVLYAVQDEQLLVVVVRLGHRREIYRRLG